MGGFSAACALEWRIALRRPRLVFFNVAIPLALVAVVAGAGAPAFHAAAIYAVVFVLFATFGAAIPWVRDGETGWLERVALRGPPAWSLVLGRTATAAALDLLELAPSAALVVWFGSRSAWDAIVLAVALAASVLAANLLGCWVAAAARSVAEAALFAAVAALFLLHFGGTFRTPEPGSAAAAAQPWIPFGALHDTLLAVGGGGVPTSSGAWILGGWATLSLAGATALAAPWLIARLTRPES